MIWSSKFHSVEEDTISLFSQQCYLPQAFSGVTTVFHNFQLFYISEGTPIKHQHIELLVMASPARQRAYDIHQQIHVKIELYLLLFISRFTLNIVSISFKFSSGANLQIVIQFLVILASISQMALLSSSCISVRTS